MSTIEATGFQEFLESHDERSWHGIVLNLLPSIHPVDRNAVRIWFAFWPLKLNRILEESQDRKETIRQYLLDGRFPLAECLDESVEFLYGARYWSEVKQALLRYPSDEHEPSSRNLETRIRQLAEELAKKIEVPASHLSGIVAVGFMALRQVGREHFERLASRPSTRPSGRETPEQVLERRNRRSSEGLLSFLRTVDRRFRVTFDENRTGHAYPAIQGQDLTMAAVTDGRDWKSRDHRRVEGVIPTQCRSGACGYCWVGVLAGAEKLSPIGDFERRRLKYFGYASAETDGETHPLVRLGCQATCRGDVTIVIPPWNGSLDGRR